MAVAQTSIDAFHGQVKESKKDQHALILAAMSPHRDYSMQELRELTGLQTSTLSARLYEMRDKMTPALIEHGPKRLCTVSKVTVHPHRVIKKGQLELIQ
jgi:hypothetical protein